MISDSFKAYIAGVADSDGSFSIAKRKRSDSVPYHIIMFQLTWIKSPAARKFMQTLVDTYGGSICEITTTQPSQFANAKPYIKYCVVAKGCESLLKDVIPFLQLKRTQARNMLRLRKFVSHKYCRKNPKPKKLRDFESKLYAINRFLNGQGLAKNASN